MSPENSHRGFSQKQLESAISDESKKFEKFYSWLEKHMPSSFFEEIDEKNLMLVTHNLMNFNLQDFFSQINLKNEAIVMCPDGPEADIRILKYCTMHGIRYYRTFISNEPPPFPELNSKLRIAIIHFTEAVETEELSANRIEELRFLVKGRNPDITDEEFEHLLKGLTTRFLRSMTTERLTLALDMYFRAQSRDHCQYEVRYNENWEAKSTPSMQIVLAWRNTPKRDFLYHMAQTIFRHDLDMQHVVMTYIDPYSTNSTLIMSMALHGQNGGAAWDEADIPEFLRELAMVKYFEYGDKIEEVFISSKQMNGNLGNLVRTFLSFIHQILVHSDPYLYSLPNIEEGLCRHPELTLQLYEIFQLKFHPEYHNIEEYHKLRNHFLSHIDDLDTGQAVNDMRRKNILRQGLNFIDHILKTNYYRTNKTSLSFRLDPSYLNYVPYNAKEKFPELPYGIFYIKGLHFSGFHIRFKDLSRGGLRTVIPEKYEHLIIERNNIFSECYNLAYTQHKKNKDIPEGGSKAVILLEPFESILSDAEIYIQEMRDAGMDETEIKTNLNTFKRNQKLEYLYQSQRSFINSFLTILNCDEKGNLRAKHIVDYWKKPEYIYLGPDENMHNKIIEWIAAHSLKHGYKPGSSFITSKPSAGINHKQYGVTSLGVSVYMHEVLLYLGIDPEKDPFTIKISGGPDGDVAGNMIVNFQRYYHDTAKILALTDISGTIYDPEGLDLDELLKLFYAEQSIRFYPPEKLSEGGFLLDLRTKREQKAYAQQTLCWRKQEGQLIEDWVSGNEMNHLFRNNVHQTQTDIFIPAGGRPRTLNESNYKDFLDETGKPTSKAIIEGANLYLTQPTRRILEKLGVLIIKDSSSNKAGVTCSSFEVLSSLALEESEFLKGKEQLVKDILAIIQKMALDEAKLLLHTHQKTHSFLTDISEWVSERINTYKYQLLDYLETITLSDDPKDPLIRCLMLYCPNYLTDGFSERILTKIPDGHKKAIISCYIASHLVYNRGLDWSPTIVDVLPLIAQDPNIIGSIKPIKKKP